MDQPTLEGVGSDAESPGRSAGSRYRIVRTLGAGAMGVVYEAEDTRLERTVALKFLAPGLALDPLSRARLVREARAASALDHPNVCAVYDVAETEDGRPFIIMAFHDGEPLQSRLARGAMPCEEAREVARQMAEGLRAAHARGILHRDIKPANVLLTREGQVKIVDFGLAKVAHQMLLTLTGDVMGTPAYLSPEQARGEKADARSDLWSVGAVLYEMLTGRRPFAGEEPAVVVHAVLHEEPTPVRLLAPEVPVDLATVVERALRKKPEERFQSAEDLLAALTAGTRPGPMASLGLRLRRHRRQVASLGAMAALALLAVWASPRVLGSGGRIRSLAVLPVADLSGAGKDGSLAEAVTDVLITELQRLGGLRVISRTSVMRYRHEEKTVPEIARELGVEAVMEASLQREHDEVVLRVKLVRARPEEQVWVGTYRGAYGEVASLPRQAALALAEQPAIARSKPEVRSGRAGARTYRPEAWIAYVRGRNAWLQGSDTQAGFEQSRAYFLAALDLEPEMPEAWGALASAWLMVCEHGSIAPSVAVPEARKAIKRALELDPDSPEALVAYGQVALEYDHDWAASKRAFLRAMEINPSFSTAHHLYAGGNLLRSLRFDEALEQIRRAQQLDPLASNISADVAMILSFAGRFEEAEAQIRETQRAFPEWDPSYDLLGLYREEGRFEEAARLYDGKPWEKMPPLVVTRLGEIYARAGRTEQARAVLAHVEARRKTGYVGYYHTAAIYAGLGEWDRALTDLERAYENDEEGMTKLAREHVWDPIRGDPRFRAMYRAVGLERVAPQGLVPRATRP